MGEIHLGMEVVVAGLDDGKAHVLGKQNWTRWPVFLSRPYDGNEDDDAPQKTGLGWDHDNKHKAHDRNTFRYHKTARVSTKEVWRMESRCMGQCLESRSRGKESTATRSEEDTIRT